MACEAAGPGAQSRAPPPSQAHLLEGLPELAAGRHAQLLRDVGGHLQQQHLHQPRHDPVLQREAGRPEPGHVGPAGRPTEGCRVDALPSSPAQDSTETPHPYPLRVPSASSCRTLGEGEGAGASTGRARAGRLRCRPEVGSTLGPATRGPGLTGGQCRERPVPRGRQGGGEGARVPLPTHLPHGLLQLLQADLLGLAQQRALVHLQHRHAVLTQLHHHHVRLHRADGLQGQASPPPPAPSPPVCAPSPPPRPLTLPAPPHAPLRPLTPTPPRPAVLKQLKRGRSRTGLPALGAGGAGRGRSPSPRPSCCRR